MPCPVSLTSPVGRPIKTYDVTVDLVALVVVGGILLGPILILIILPVMIDVFHSP